MALRGFVDHHLSRHEWLPSRKTAAVAELLVSCSNDQGLITINSYATILVARCPPAGRRAAAVALGARAAGPRRHPALHQLRGAAQVRVPGACHLHWDAHWDVAREVCVCWLRLPPRAILIRPVLALRLVPQQYLLALLFLKWRHSQAGASYPHTQRS